MLSRLKQLFSTKTAPRRWLLIYCMGKRLHIFCATATTRRAAINTYHALFPAHYRYTLLDALSIDEELLCDHQFTYSLDTEQDK